MNACITCRKETDLLHGHHVVPRALGGLDIAGNIVEICEECHNKIHDTKFTNHAELIRTGLAKAKKAGVRLGAEPGHSRNTGRRKTYDPALLEAITQGTNDGLSCQEIGIQVGLSYMTIRRIQKRKGMVYE